MVELTGSSENRQGIAQAVEMAQSWDRAVQDNFYDQVPHDFARVMGIPISATSGDPAYVDALQQAMVGLLNLSRLLSYEVADRDGTSPEAVLRSAQDKTA